MISLSIESMFGPNVETSAGSHPRIIEFTPVQRHTKVRVAVLQSLHTPEHERKSSAGIGSMSGRSRLSSMIRRGLRCVWRITDFPRISDSPHTGSGTG
jgi:hypothetical protein